MKALQVVVTEVLGQLTWDLPAQQSYTPNAHLVFTVQVTNPTTGQRTYKLQAQAVVGGQLVWFADLVLEGQADAWFPIPAGGSVSVQGDFIADQTDFTFQMLLIDQAAGQAVAQVACNLVGPTTTPTTPTPTQPSTPGIGDTLSAIVPFIGLGLATGLVTGLVVSLASIFKRKE